MEFINFLITCCVGIVLWEVIVKKLVAKVAPKVLGLISKIRELLGK